MAAFVPPALRSSPPSPPSTSKASPNLTPDSSMAPAATNGIITPPPEPSTTPISTVELCIAHYNEDLSWLSPFSANCSIYSKGKQPAETSIYARFKHLPNIGRETHTYLTHITQNYDSLAHVTLFLQGNIHDINQGTPAHTDLTLAELVSAALRLSPGAVLPVGVSATFSDFDGIQYKHDWIRRRGHALTRAKLTPRDFWSWMFAGTADEKVPMTEVRFVQGACYAVTKEAVHRRPREWWGRLLRYFEELAETNPEEGHYMERMWYAIFAPDVAVVVQRREGEGNGGRGGDRDGASE